MPMQDAQKLLMMGDEVGMIEIQTTDPDRVEQILAPLAAELVSGQAIITDWRQMNSALFEALEVERVVMFIVLSHHRPRRRVQHRLVADHAGARQDPRHRDPAHDGGDAARHDAGSS